MKKLEVRFTRSPGDSLHVGTLVEDRGRVYFQYAPEFLATGLNLSPFRLPFEAGLFEHTDREFGPLPGVFDLHDLARQSQEILGGATASLWRPRKIQPRHFQVYA